MEGLKGKYKVVAICLGIASALCAQQPGGIGAKFGTHDPLTCPSRKLPTSGAISSAQATRYFTCEIEKLQDYSTRPPELIVVDKASFHVIKQVSYVAAYGLFPSLRLSDADINQPLYVIQGGYDLYSCDPVDGGNARQNCVVSPTPNNAGVCYKTQSQDWRCIVQPTSMPTMQYHGAPPR